MFYVCSMKGNTPKTANQFLQGQIYFLDDICTEDKGKGKNLILSQI